MNIWFTSDHHFGHASILTFTGDDDQLIRPGFDNVDHMNEYMIEKWNESIKPGDRVYHLGDVGFSKEAISAILPKLNGSKRLILGNHDDEIGLLSQYFKKIRLWRIFKEEGFTCSHIPLRPESFRHKTLLNVHGHIHQNNIDDMRYLNVSVECHDYSPVHMDTICQIVREIREIEDYGN